MADEDKSSLDAEWRNFKWMAIAAHPENAELVLNLETDGEADSRREREGLMRPLTDQEIAEYVPYSENIDALLEELQEFGFSLREMG